jgi:hypothetical protein
MQSSTIVINLNTARVFKMKKIRGSHQFEESTKKAIAVQAKLENRTFNNMLEELAKRQLAAQ